jgi:transposase
MAQFIEGLDRQQTMLLPEHLDDYVDENSPVRAIDAFADMLDLAALGFNVQPASTGRPGYHPGLMLRIYLYGYLNQIQSSRRLERECGRNLELIWLTGRLKPDFKTIADFRKDNGPAIRKVCRGSKRCHDDRSAHRNRRQRLLQKRGDCCQRRGWHLGRRPQTHDVERCCTRPV